MKNLLIILIVFAASGCSHYQKAVTEIRKTVKKFETRIENKEEGLAELLSPKELKEARFKLSKVKSYAREGRSRKEIDNLIDEIISHLRKVDKNIKSSRKKLHEVLTVREKSLINGSNDEMDDFNRADNELKKIGKELEVNSEKEVAKGDLEKIIKLYRKATVRSREIKELSRSRRLIDEAENLNSLKYFMPEYKNVTKRINKISKAMLSNKKISKKVITRLEKSAERLFILTNFAEKFSQDNIRESILELDDNLNEALKPLEYKNPKNISFKEKMRLIKKETKNVPFLMEQLTGPQYDNYMERKKKDKSI